MVRGVDSGVVITKIANGGDSQRIDRELNIRFQAASPGCW